MSKSPTDSAVTTEASKPPQAKPRAESFAAKLRRLKAEGEAERTGAALSAEEPPPQAPVATPEDLCVQPLLAFEPADAAIFDAPEPEPSAPGELGNPPETSPALPPPPSPGPAPDAFKVTVGAGTRPLDILSLLRDIPDNPEGAEPPAEPVPPPVSGEQAAPALVVRAGNRPRDILSLLEEHPAETENAAPEPAPSAARPAALAPDAIPPPDAPPALVNGRPPLIRATEPPAISTCPREPDAAPRPPEKIHRFWVRRHRHAETALPLLPPHRHHHAHPHLRLRTDADARFVRGLTVAGAGVILPAIVLGWRLLVPDEAQMVDRLVADGRLKEAAEISNRLADNAKGGPDYRFLSAAMLVEKATGAGHDERRAAFARALNLARTSPGDALAASTAAKALNKLAVCDGADAFFEENAPGMPAHIATIWVEGLVERHLADARPDSALRSAIIGWDAAPGRAVSAEYLLRVARQANKADAVTSRLRDYVVTGARHDLIGVYRTAMREAGREAEALAELWPVIMLQTQPAGYEDLAKSILACGPSALPAQTAELIERALKSADLPAPAGIALISLCHSRTLLGPANALVDKLSAAGCDSPEFLRLAAHTKLWSDKPGLALSFIRRAYLATGDDADFDEAFRIAVALSSTRDIVALCERRGARRLDDSRRALYADSLTGLGDYDAALRVFRTSSKLDAGTLAKVARLERALRRTEEALVSYRKLVALEPKNEEWRDREFRLLVTLGRNAEAASAAEAAWHALGDPRRLRDGLRAAVSAGDREATLRLAELATRAARTGEPAALLEACHVLRQARREEPRAAILAVLAERFPQRLDLARELAVYDFNRGRFDLVERRFDLTPALRESRENCALLLTARLTADNRDGARDLLESALRSHPDWADYDDFAEVATRACIALRLDDTADELHPRFLARRAGAPRMRALAARLLAMRGRNDEALPLFGEMGERLTPDLRMDYARSLAATGRFADAESQMLLVVAASPKPDPRTLSALGDLRLSSGAAEPARDAYRRALGLLEAKQ